MLRIARLAMVKSGLFCEVRAEIFSPTRRELVSGGSIEKSSAGVILSVVAGQARSQAQACRLAGLLTALSSLLRPASLRSLAPT